MNYGEWQNDKAHGYGIKTFANGDSHEGYYKADRRHGQGRYRWSSGEHYDGGWYEGQQHGRGVYTFDDGSVFFGLWSHGLKTGAGVLKSKSAGRGGENGGAPAERSYVVEMWESGVLLWDQPIDASVAEEVLQTSFADKDWF